MSEPRTVAGRSDHDESWEGRGYGNHDAVREGCAACEWIARIEAEAARSGPEDLQEGYALLRQTDR